jgi:hypothetical protein
MRRSTGLQCATPDAFVQHGNRWPETAGVPGIAAAVEILPEVGWRGFDVAWRQEPRRLRL